MRTVVRPRWGLGMERQIWRAAYSSPKALSPRKAQSGLYQRVRVEDTCRFGRVAAHDNKRFSAVYMYACRELTTTVWRDTSKSAGNFCACIQPTCFSWIERSRTAVCCPPSETLHPQNPSRVPNMSFGLHYSRQDQKRRWKLRERCAVFRNALKIDCHV